ncbi:hypothetical protein GCM10028862_19070 [Luteimonas pelagia]
MRRTLRPAIAASLVALWAATLVPATAEAQRDRGRQDRGQQDRAREARAEPRDRAHGAQQDHRALGDAVRRVERATRGQVLSAERVRYDGREINRVKVIDDRGRVRVYWDDPQSSGSDRDPRSRSRDGGDPNL